MAYTLSATVLEVHNLIADVQKLVQRETESRAKYRRTEAGNVIDESLIMTVDEEIEFLKFLNDALRGDFFQVIKPLVDNFAGSPNPVIIDETNYTVMVRWKNAILESNAIQFDQEVLGYVVDYFVGHWYLSNQYSEDAAFYLSRVKQRITTLTNLSVELRKPII